MPDVGLKLMIPTSIATTCPTNQESQVSLQSFLKVLDWVRRGKMAEE